MQMKKNEMKGFAITHRGAEEICTEEIAELLGIKNSEIEILKTFIIFPIKNPPFSELNYSNKLIIPQFAPFARHNSRQT